MPRLSDTAPERGARTWVQLTPDELDRFRAAARSEHRSMSGQLRKLIADYLDQVDRRDVVDHQVAA